MSEILEIEVIRIFGKLEDPRVDRTKRHKLIDIIGTTLMGSLSGMQNWVEIAEWSKTNLIWLKKWFELPSGVPSHDTYGAVFAAIDAVSFQNKFKEWIDFLKVNFSTKIIIEKEVVGFDGKALRGSKVSKKSINEFVTTVNVFACKANIVIGQYSTRLKKNEGEKKTMEKLIDSMDLKGKIVTIDAGGATMPIVNKIVNQGGDCIIGLKGNQPASKKLAEKIIERQDFKDNYKAITTKNSGHGRKEEREYKLININSLDTNGLEKEIAKFRKKWPDIASIGVANSKVVKNGKSTSNTRFFLTTVTNLIEFAEAARIHWKIESKLHWVLDVVLREDNCRTRNGNSASNLSLIRKTALNLLTINTNQKDSTRTKQIKCANDKKYLENALGGAKKK